MHITKNESGYYEAHIKGADGRRHSISTRRKNRREAVELLSKAKVQELELAAELGVLQPNVVSVIVAGQKVSVDQAIEPWKEWLGYKRQSANSIANAEMWVRAWASSMNLLTKPVMSITERHLDPWVNSTSSNNKLGTRKVMLSCLRSFFAFLSARGWIMGNPAQLIKVDPFPLLHGQKETYRQSVFDDDEITRLIECLSPGAELESPFWRAAVEISRHCGLRLSDIASLEWSCLSVPGKIMVWTMKRDRRVELPLAPQAMVDALQAVPRNHPVFVFPRERAIIRDPKRRAVLSTEFSGILSHCRIYGKSFHGLRATAATSMSKRGVPIDIIAAILGHHSAATTQIYIR